MWNMGITHTTPTLVHVAYLPRSTITTTAPTSSHSCANFPAYVSVSFYEIIHSPFVSASHCTFETRGGPGGPDEILPHTLPSQIHVLASFSGFPKALRSTLNVWDATSTSPKTSSPSPTFLLFFPSSPSGSNYRHLSENSVCISSSVYVTKSKLIDVIRSYAHFSSL